jgi:exodeoxyribonuclease VII small subunit
MTNDIEEMTFEEAFAELEQIVSRLEGGQLALEDSLMLFERGQALAASCSQKLDQAELKIEQITPEGDRPLNVEG